MQSRFNFIDPISHKIVNLSSSSHYFIIFIWNILYLPKPTNVTLHVSLSVVFSPGRMRPKPEAILEMELPKQIHFYDNLCVPKSSWSCLLTKGNRKDPNQSFGVCNCTNQFSLCECGQTVLTSNHGSPLVPWDLISSTSASWWPPQQKQFVRKENDAHTEDWASNHPEGGVGAGSQTTGRFIRHLHKVHTNTGNLCMFLERVHSCLSSSLRGGLWR